MPTESAVIAVLVSYMKSNVLCYLRHRKTECFIHLPLCWFCTTRKTNKQRADLRRNHKACKDLWSWRSLAIFRYYLFHYIWV